MEPHRQDNILRLTIIRNMPVNVPFLHLPESDPEAAVHCHSLLLALKDLSATAIATAVVVWTERSDLKGTMQRGTGPRDSTTHTPPLVDAPSPHATVDTPNVVITQMRLVLDAEADLRLGRLMRMINLRNLSAHTLTLNLETSVIPHGLVPAVPRSRILIRRPAQWDDPRLEALQSPAHNLVCCLLSSTREMITLVPLKIAALAGLEKKQNTAMSPDSLQVDH